MYTILLAAMGLLAAAAPATDAAKSIEIQFFGDADCQQPLKNATASAGKCINVDLANGYGSMALPANADIFTGCKWNMFVKGDCLFTPNIDQGPREVTALEGTSGFFDTEALVNCFPTVYYLGGAGMRTHGFMLIEP
jgi:hypothetical protein